VRWCPCTLVTPRAEDTRWEKQGLRSSRGHWRPRQRPRLDEPASSTGSWNSSFRRPPSQRLRMAMRGPNKSTRQPRHHMPASSRQRRATQLSGRLPTCFVRHEEWHFVCDIYMLCNFKQHTNTFQTIQNIYTHSTINCFCPFIVAYALFNVTTWTRPWGGEQEVHLFSGGTSRLQI